MPRETGTRFKVWVDHLVVAVKPALPIDWTRLGFERQQGLVRRRRSVVRASRRNLSPHRPGTVRASDRTGREAAVRDEVAIKVERVADFSRAHDLGLEIAGYSMGPYRVGRVPGDDDDAGRGRAAGLPGFRAVSGRAGARGANEAARGTRRPGGTRPLAGRRRRFDDDEEGFDATEATLERVIELAGSTDLACHLVFEVERDYWQSRNTAARVQKARQDRLGLGWANHDHHTFRCSRRFFPAHDRHVHPARVSSCASGSTPVSTPAGVRRSSSIPSPASSSSPISIWPPKKPPRISPTRSLPDLPRPGTVGLWVALHGESILEAGMHHLEAQFDFDALRDGLKAEAGIETMPPFSNFPFLRQAFTAGERWPVAEHRADRALAQGWINAEQHEKFLREGTIGSHLENLERREGYKGFNQQAVSAIIAATDPRLH